MYKLHYKNGLLYATVDLYVGNRHVSIEDAIVDTGAFHTIILTDFLEELDVEFSNDDELVKTSGYGGIQYSSIRKQVDRIKIGDMYIDDVKIDFGVIDPYERVNGLIGLDFLKGAGTIIDLVDLTLSKKK